jgi:Carboxypeptidase regulatory-like domain
VTESFNPQAAFATGLIVHEGTGRPLDGEIQITADEGEVSARVLESGRFVVSSYARFDGQVHLKIRAASPQYRAGSAGLDVAVAIPPGADFDPDPPATPTPLVDLGTLLLPADPVNLRGRAVNAADTEQPLDGAAIEITHAGPDAIAPVLTDGDGYYRFDEIVVRAPATIQCSKPNFQTETRLLLLDYGRLVNEEYFRLPPV